MHAAHLAALTRALICSTACRVASVAACASKPSRHDVHPRPSIASLPIVSGPLFQITLEEQPCTTSSLEVSSNVKHLSNGQDIILFELIRAASMMWKVRAAGCAIPGQSGAHS
jgi:hypothetical protein